MTVTANPAVAGSEGGATGGAEQGWPHDAGPHQHYKYLHNKEIIGQKLAVVTIVIPSYP